MICAWEAYLNLLPPQMRTFVNKQGSDILIEMRLRLGRPPQLITRYGSCWMQQCVTRDDLNFCLNVACRYSAWSTESPRQGYITANGGHRIGLCGRVATDKGKIVAVQSLSSLCIRVARDFPGLSAQIKGTGSMLIIGRPGSGKTTILRDLIRRQNNVCVIDEREEIFPLWKDQFVFPTGDTTDVLSGCSKRDGLEIALRCMGPDTIAIDEITSQEDCLALLHAGWCGVKLIATAHAGSKEDLFTRPVYGPIINAALFDTLVVLNSDKSWKEERLKI